MKSLNKIIGLLSILFLLNACSDDEGTIINIFGAAFDTTSLNLDESENYTISLVFNKPASENGTITISYEVENALYNTDFNTLPIENETNKIVISFSENEVETSFEFHKLQNAIQGQNKIVNFKIDAITHSNSQISGNTETQISFNEIASLGTSLEPSIGGPNENNSVYIDLSSESEKVIQRDVWDLGFYAGNDFKVMLNATIGMAAGELNTIDIDAVNSSNSEVQNIQSLALISTNDGSNVPYFDSSDGDINGMVISEIFEDDNLNKVYLINLGFELSNETPETGTANISGDLKGWKKIRIVRSADDYIMQYADLDATSHQQVTISKDNNYNFTFFNFDTNATVIVEPNKGLWDLHFTPHSKEFLFGGGSAGFIFFSDMVVTNTKNNVSVYLVDGEYDGFQLNDVDNTLFSLDHSTIGSSWRSVFSGTVVAERFYILKDTEDNVYKIEFTALLGTDTDNLGERGFPKFRYELLE